MGSSTVSLPTFAPWHADIATAWLTDRERFAHAWLIHGLPGTGKVEFARAAAAALLCEAPRGHLACGACPACVWMASGNHPDFRRIRPDAVAAEEGEDEESAEDGAEPVARSARKTPSRDIRVEQIRAMESWVTTGTHRGGLRVVVLYPADSLNVVSANALLKILEEPPPQTVFLLVSDAPDRLLPTLVSRCRRLPLPVPRPDVALSWLTAREVDAPAARLAASGGAPMAALRTAQAGEPPRPTWLDTLVGTSAAGQALDVGALVAQVEKQAARKWLDALQRLLMDVALVQQGLSARYFPDDERDLARIAPQANAVAVLETARWLQRQQRVADHPLNAKLFAHETLARVAQALGSAREKARAR